MKVTYNWLKDFVDIRIGAKQLADKLTMAGLEVTGLEEKEGDFVFEIEVTSNRPDCLSVVGIAREVAAVTGKKLKIAPSKKLKTAAGGRTPLSIKIEDKKDCPLYTGKIISGVKVGESPDWIKKRLELVGCRSVNSIVDITNYILFEWGQPLHAFDLDKLKSPDIIVRRARKNERLTAIDESTKALDPDVLVIADEEKPVALAGIMGGKLTEVSLGTKNVLLESAAFDPVLIRRARQKLGLSSESAYRFERGVDLDKVNQASLRALDLIREVAGGVCVSAKAQGTERAPVRNVNLNILNAQKILGVDIAPAKVKGILSSLQLGVKIKNKVNLSVKIPSFRRDINSDVDLVEEIARVYGYDNIPKTIPFVRPPENPTDARDKASLIKNILAGLGLDEVITYSLIDRDLLRGFGIDDTRCVEIQNPLSKEQEVLRPSLAPSLASCVAYNLNQKQNYIGIFELADVFTSGSSYPQEEPTLGIALCGTKTWLLEQGLVREEVGLLDLKGALEVLFGRLGIDDFGFSVEADNEASVFVGGEKTGKIISLDKGALDYLDIKNRQVWVLELSLRRVLVLANLNKRFAPLPVFPGITRDISLILKKEISVTGVMEAIKEKASPLIKEVKITDYYKGKQIPPGYKGLTISCFYRSDERTLTESEITPIHSGVSLMLIERFSAQIRA